MTRVVVGTKYPSSVDVVMHRIGVCVEGHSIILLLLCGSVTVCRRLCLQTYRISLESDTVNAIPPTHDDVIGCCLYIGKRPML